MPIVFDSLLGHPFKRTGIEVPIISIEKIEASKLFINIPRRASSMTMHNQAAISVQKGQRCTAALMSRAPTTPP
jgi:hypothetical protein